MAPRAERSSRAAMRFREGGAEGKSNLRQVSGHMTHVRYVRCQCRTPGIRWHQVSFGAT